MDEIEIGAFERGLMAGTKNGLEIGKTLAKFWLLRLASEGNTSEGALTAVIKGLEAHDWEELAGLKA